MAEYVTDEPVLSGELREEILPGFEQCLRVQGTPMLDAVVTHGLILGHPGAMLSAVRSAHRAELARLARELHDRTAHTIGVAIQNLELHEMHAGRDAVQAQEKLVRARAAMEQALDSVRHFLGELRRTVRPGELEQALAEYLGANADNGILVSLKVSGDTSALPAEVCEEVYVTVREAIRNALLHSGATRIEVALEISESRLHAWVSDTGCGFSIEQVMKTGDGIGLSSMRERVELLGGTLRLISVPGHGATVDMVIPLGTDPR